MSANISGNEEKSSGAEVGSGTGGSMPDIRIGNYRISRLVSGDNPVNGGSHLSRFVDNQMKRYFTREQIFEYLRDCERCGINTWQTNAFNMELYRSYIGSGGKIKMFSLVNEKKDGPDALESIKSAGGIGAVHHGGPTDVFYKAGQMHLLREYCKKIRETGLMVGVSTHLPAVVEQISSESWDVDFMMCCVYKRYYTREELVGLLGAVPLPVGEVFLDKDPPQMLEAIRHSSKPCFAFKILAAGRLCNQQKTVEEAFKSTLAGIKSGDGVIVGMYPEYEDQITLNAGYVKKYS